MESRFQREKTCRTLPSGNGRVASSSLMPGIPDSKTEFPQWILPALQTGEWMERWNCPPTGKPCGLNFDGTVWFQKEVEIPADWSGKEISFHLAGGSTTATSAYFGKEIGRTSGCNTMRTIRFPPALAKVGKGVITIRAIDYGVKVVSGEPQADVYGSERQEDFPLAGNWNHTLSINNRRTFQTIVSRRNRLADIPSYRPYFTMQ